MCAQVFFFAFNFVSTHYHQAVVRFVLLLFDFARACVCVCLCRRVLILCAGRETNNNERRIVNVLVLITATWLHSVDTNRRQYKSIIRFYFILLLFCWAFGVTKISSMFHTIALHILQWRAKREYIRIAQRRAREETQWIYWKEYEDTASRPRPSVKHQMCMRNHTRTLVCRDLLLLVFDVSHPIPWYSPLISTFSVHLEWKWNNFTSVSIILLGIHTIQCGWTIHWCIGHRMMWIRCSSIRDIHRIWRGGR